MSVRMFGQLDQDDQKRLIVRILGHRVGTADGWFHWGGWAMVTPGFIPDDGLAKFFPDEIIAGPFELPTGAVLGLLVDYYTGQLALIEMPQRAQMTSEPRVLAQAQITV